MARRSGGAPRTAGAGLALLMGAALVAIAAPAALAADQSVSIAGFAFAPATVTVSEGDTITWSNEDGVAHTATAGDGSFDTGSIAGGASAGVTFETAGTFAYICTIHPTMSGTVVVEAAAASPSPTVTSAPAASSGPTAPPTDMALERSARPSPDGRAGLATALALFAAALGAGALLSLRFRVADIEDDDRG